MPTLISVFLDPEFGTFLRFFPASARRRGMNYFEAGAVRDLRCSHAGSLFGAKVIGERTIQVSLMHDPIDGWDSECTCATGGFCKHAYAAALAFQSLAMKSGGSGLDAAGGHAPASMAGSSQASAPHLAPPSSVLSTKLEAAHGRLLTRSEAYYVASVQTLYREAKAGRPVTPWSMRQLAPALHDFSSIPLTLWDEFPADDWELWLYCACEIRRRNLKWPPFMDAVTDLGVIQPKLKNLEYRSRVALWKRQLGELGQFIPEPGTPIDFRVRILPDRAQLEFRMRPEADYQAVRPGVFQDLQGEYRTGNLAVTPEALPLWALFNTYENSPSPVLTYNSRDGIRTLNGILRVPTFHERVVCASGAALDRPADRLRYALREGSGPNASYGLDLVREDGSPVGKPLLALHGNPPLYLFESAVHAGPAPHGFGSQPVEIPAEALETRDGVTFLERLKVGLPERIEKRITRTPVRVVIDCRLQPTAPGVRRESMLIDVTASAKGMRSEQFTMDDWKAVGPAGLPAPAEGDRIALLDRSAQRHFPRITTEIEAKWDFPTNRWRVRIGKDFPVRFTAWMQSIPPECELRLDPQLATLRDAPVAGSVTLSIDEVGVDWFDLRVVLNAADTELTHDELKVLLNARGGYVRLGAKGWRRLQFNLSEEEEENLAHLGLNARDFSAEPQRLHALQLSNKAARKFLPEQQAESIDRRASELKARVAPPVPSVIHAQLRPYQVEGFHFLAYLAANRFGGILADDMGLGKTLQTLTWLAWSRSETPAPIPASLVVCPKSVIDNWTAEAARFFPELRVTNWRGAGNEEFEALKAESDLMVLNYSQLRSLSPGISQHRWHAVILDEAQYIKNPDSQTAQVARTLQAAHRLALTGTPIENRLLDLWSIMSFAMPGVLGNRAQFARTYNQQDDPFARRRLSARVRPFLLRRTKTQVAQDLPDRTEEDMICEMEAEQLVLYRAEFKRAQQLLLKVQTQKELNEQRFHFLTSLLRLRQICCHPILVNKDLVKAESAKVNALIDLLDPILQEGHKVLVFSQFVTMLEILRETIRQKGWTEFYLTGESENRGELVKEFQEKPGEAVFLISLKAGGFGLNLTAASYVVLFDPWWNPAVEAQAIDRTHRIGQTSKVIAYRLLIKDSIEQKIRQLQKSKAAIAQDILGEEKFAQSLTLDDLRFLLAGD